MPFIKYEPWCEFAHGLPFDTKWPERRWPSQRILRAPRWCSVDLRDGDQALVNPMNVLKKIRYFKTLVDMGFKEIEIGLPSASRLDFDFTRLLIEKEEIPNDVWLMVLVPAREHLIRKTVEALRGAKNVIIHLYISTSELQRRVVFNLPKEDIKAMAVKGTELVRALSDEYLTSSGCRVRFEYSPESFTATEVHFSLEICHAVIDAWGPTEEDPIILNLPETVQHAGPHFYADQIEWMHNHLRNRDKVIVSVHPHNDRGTGIASAELAMQAGADRVEGCLFGNGERTGNVCLVTVAINLLHHGIDPELNVSNLPLIVKMFEECTGLQVHERHPWAGSLIYTAFSGSHQDAIKKGLEAMKKKKDQLGPIGATARQSRSTSSMGIWEVPYLPIDPRDLGRSYEAIIRINSQSGKGGVAFILESEYGIMLPKDMQGEVSQCIQLWCDQSGKEIDPSTVYRIFRENFLELRCPITLIAYKVSSRSTCHQLQNLLNQSGAIVAPSESFTVRSGLAPSSRVDHKRARTLTTPTPSEQSPKLSPKRRDLGKTDDGLAPATSEENGKSSRVTLITSATVSPEVTTNLENSLPIVGRNGIGVSVVESPSSDWLVIDRPILTDEPLAVGGSIVQQSNGACPSDPIQGQLTTPPFDTDPISIDARILFKNVTTGREDANETRGFPVDVRGQGNGPINALIVGFNQLNDEKNLFGGSLHNFEIQSYHEMAVGKGSSVEAICFIELKAEARCSVDIKCSKKNLDNTSDVDGNCGTTAVTTTHQGSVTQELKCWGAARHANTTTASLYAICSAVNRLARFIVSPL